jgi:hypothetical protein
VAGVLNCEKCADANSRAQISSGRFRVGPDSALGHRATLTRPITSTIRGVPLQGHGAVNLHREVVVAQKRLGRRVANLSTARIEEVCVALRFSLGCL